MKRIIDYFLLQWKQSRSRKPLLLRGARQVGKTYAVRQLGKTYESFVEINFEINTEVHAIFEKNLDPHGIIHNLSLLLKKQIIPGVTLLFLDEIQMTPRAIIALRYFYEMMPELHVIAAGSLLDFAIEQIGVPVGRVEYLYMHPVSFIEYLGATENQLAITSILAHNPVDEVIQPVHDMLLDLVGQYCAIGGMPYAIKEWIDGKNALECGKNHSDLLNTYRHDFGKYARKLQIKYVELIFDQIPQQLGRKFKYSLVEGDYRKRELAPALDLLVTAGIAHKVFYSAGQGLPLGAQIDPLDYRVIFLDIGLTQANLSLDIAGWFLQPGREFINKGSLIEAFVGQEMAAYAMPYKKTDLFYWHKESNADVAEIDYLVQIGGDIIPIEVKSGTGRSMKSMHYFLENHKKSPYGIRFSANNYSQYDKINSYPLYAIAQVISESHPEMKLAYEYLAL